jgi:hypothetical protein
VLEDDTSQLHGMALLVDLRDLPSQNLTNIHFNRKASKLFFEMIRDALPISINAIHPCWPSEKSIQAILMPFVSWLMGKDLRLRRIIHKGEPSVLLSSLKRYCLEKESIPAAIGGSWNEFENWMELRLQLELERERNDHQ